jgi:peptidyl-dipeptidase Dcp
MRRRTFLLSLTALSLASALPAAPNPLLSAWVGPYGGVPAFDQIKVSLFESAFASSMAEYRAQLQALGKVRSAPTFENTIALLEDSGRTYRWVQTLFGIYTSTMNSAEVQKLDRAWRPKFAALEDDLIQNSGIFRRIQAVYAAKKGTPEQQRLTWLYYTMFVRSGARLGAAQKKQLSAYNQQLASLYARFSQNQLADEEQQMLVLEKEEDLAGLPDSLRQGAAAVAKERGLAGKWVIANTRSAAEPFLTYSERRDLREKCFRMWTRRGDMGGAHDNNAIVTQILRLRAKRAKLLGYPTFAHWRLENSMAGTPQKAMELMMKVWPAAKQAAAREVAEMQKLAPGLTLEPWDYRFYAEKVRQARYQLDANEVKQYLQLAQMLKAIFWMAEQLYGFQFRPADKVSVVHPDVSVYEVLDAKGKHVGLWYFDPYARAGKSSGAWMSEYRTQENFRKPVTPIVSNNSNFVKSGAGPVLISFDDAETMFHEFGHALHGLNSRVHYPMLAGTNVARDFVEFPSQFHEHYLSTPEILNRFALHKDTGKPMPEELMEKMHKASTFNQGFATVEFLASAIVDMKLHLAGDVEIDPRQFEKEALAELGMPREIVMRHRIPAFGHLFSDDGYAAGYYSYLWSEVLDHDAYQAFVEAGSPYHRATADRFKRCIMEVGNTLDSAQAYRNFRGRDPVIEPLLRDRGFLA